MTSPRAPALRAIIAYKTVKAALQLGSALLLVVLWPFGLPLWIHELGLALHQHTTHAGALFWVDRLTGSATARGLELGIAALFADGALTALEAWALASGRWWGPWLVVCGLGALLPFEVYEFVRTPRLSRALIFSLNALIAAYLGHRAWREHRELGRTRDRRPQ